MRRVIVSTFLSVDGVMQAPGGPDEDEDAGFGLGGWSVHFWDDMMAQTMDAAMSVPFDLLLGHKTYDIFAAYWPYASDEEGAMPLNTATKYVASRSPRVLTWERSVQIEGDVAEGVAALKSGEGPELQVHGSGNLAQTLMRHGLIDEYRLWVFPVLLGKGKRLFADGIVPGALELLDSKVSSTGVVISTYVPRGEVPLGSFAHE